MTAKAVVRAMGLGMAALLLAAAGPTGFEGEKFLEALRTGDSGRAVSILNERGNALANVRGAKGETALSIVIRRHDSNWLYHLLKIGADPSMRDENGDPPIVLAARLGDDQTIRDLLAHRAKVDEPNRGGETALIVAVQQRRVPTVKLLLEQGADPSVKDHVAGYSARDYAARDRRMADIVKLLDAPAAKPKLNFSGPFR